MNFLEIQKGKPSMDVVVFLCRLLLHLNDLSLLEDRVCRLFLCFAEKRFIRS